MNDVQPPARPSRHLRTFVAWSLVLHAGAGIAWGLPAWMRLQAERELEQTQKAWAAHLAEEAAKAKAHALAQRVETTRKEVEAQLRQQFDKLTATMAEKNRDKLWQEVASHLQDKTRDLARALLAETLTEQDLRNLEAQLQRDLLEQTDQALTAETAQAMAERFVDQVDSEVAPELAKWMREQVRDRVANRLRDGAEQLVREQRDGGADRERTARRDLRQFGESELKDTVTQAFTEEFRAETVPRLTPKLAQAFKEQLTQSGLTDERLVAEVAKRAGELLATRVPELAKAGEPVGERFRNLAPDGAAKAPATAKAIDLGVAATGAEQSAEPRSALDQKLDAGKAKLAADAKDGLDQIAKDGQRDGEWVKRASGGTTGNDGDAELRDRIGRMAEGMRNGRVGTGSGPGLGAMRGGAVGRGIFDRHVRDEAAYRALSQQIADRGLVQGAQMERTGATGETAQAAERSGAGPARTAGRDNAQAKLDTGSTAPYQPTFKTLAFAAIPNLPGTFAIDGRPGKWEGIPALALKPEYGNDQSAQTMQIGWRSDGLFCRFSISDPDRHLTKTSVAGFWQADTVEVWIDCLNTKEKYRSRHSGQQFWVWPDGSSDDPGLAGGESLTLKRDSGYQPRALRLDALPRATTMTPQGYIVEFQLSATLLEDADLTPGRIVGLNAYVSTKSTTDWYWSAGKKVDTFAQPDTWGDLLLAGSDATISLAGRSGPASASPAVLIPGQPLRLRVSDGDMDLSPQRRDKVMVTVKPAHGGQQIAVLEETSESSGVFEGALSTSLALGDDQAGTLAVYEGETVVAEYIDQARANGSRNVEVKLPLGFGSVLSQRVVSR